MKRSLDQAVSDLRAHITGWLAGGARPGVRVFVYPPEWEAAMLPRLTALAAESATAGTPLDIVDVGQGFLAELEQSGLVDPLTGTDADASEWMLHDLGEVALQYLSAVVATPPASGHVARMLVNIGALATFVSYSALISGIGDAPSPDLVALPTIIAFPGEGDERSLNLLRLRSDTNYRVPRI